MKKTLSHIGLALALGILISSQNAAAFERGGHDDRHSTKRSLSHEEHSPKDAGRQEFRGDRGHHKDRSHHPVHYERRLPAGYRTLKIANRILYYLNGIFYQSTPYGYQVVSAPMGTVIRELPYGYYQVWYGGTVYYVYNNTYYTRGPRGYRVVMPPARGIMFPVQAGW